MRKRVLCHMRTTKVQISLRIRAVWSALCCSLLRQYDMYTCYIQSFKIVPSFCSWAGWFESYLVENQRRHLFAWCGSSDNVRMIIWAILWDYCTFRPPYTHSSNVHVQPSTGARYLIFGWTFRLLPYFMCANSEGSGKTVRMRRLAWALTGRLCDKYHNLMSWLNFVFILANFHTCELLYLPHLRVGSRF